MKSRISICGLFLVAFVMYAPVVHAQASGSPSGGGGSQWRAMRQEMVAACANESAGAACSFSREGQTVNGTCRATRRGQLVCRTGKRREGRGMPGPMGSGTPSSSAPQQ